MTITFDPASGTRWSFRGARGRFVPRTEVDAQLARLAASTPVGRSWPARHASANVADAAADARAFLDVATPHPRPARAARLRAAHAADAWGLDRRS